MPDGVIQQQQQALAGYPVTPQRDPGLQAGRDPPGGDPGHLQQAGQRIGRVHRPVSGRVPVQGQENLPVRESRRQLVGGVHRERRLADPGHPADRVDSHHPAGTGCARRRGRQLPHLRLPARERGDIAGQRPRRRRHPARLHARCRGSIGRLSAQGAGDRRAQRRRVDRISLLAAAAGQQLDLGLAEPAYRRQIPQPAVLE